MSPPGTKTARSGCFTVVGPVILCFVLFIIFGWPKYLDRHGTAASGVITEKRENIHTFGDNWTRRLEVIATYSIPGQIMQHRAGCDVDEKTYDSLHAGDRVTVHYFAALLQQPFIPATDLSPCVGTASLGLQSRLARPFVIAIASLLVILFFWRLLRINGFAWLFLLWLGVVFAYFVVPRVEPEPQHPVSATATIHSVAVVSTLAGGADHKSIPLLHPYQMVVVEFVPPGMDAPVKAVDKVDLDSLKIGQPVNILYDAANPRIARLQQGTRNFPQQARTTVILLGGAWILLVLIGAGISAFFRRVGRGLSRAAMENAVRVSKLK